MTFDVYAVRAQFPSVAKAKAIYFDNPAGTQVPQAVIDAVGEYYLTANANQGGAFATSRRSDEMFMEASRALDDFLNGPSPYEIVFGQNMTTLNYGLSRAIGKTLNPGDEIVLTRMDHDANVSPWLQIAEDGGLTVRWVDLHPADATLNLDSLRLVLSEKTKVVATVHASNAVGTINPIAQIAAWAHEVGAYHVVDAVQSAPHLPIDVQALGCDFLLCSAYKFFGPHVGVMWGKYELLAELPAYKVRPAKDKPPYRWETGTPSFETIHGTAAAIRYLQTIGKQYGVDHAELFGGFAGRRLDLKAGMAALQAYERELVAHLIEVLGRLPGAHIHGITDPARYDERVPTVVFGMENHTPRQIAAHLGKHDIYVWDGHYYALEVMDRLGHAENGLVRVGLAHYNTHEEINRFEEVMHDLG